MLNGNSFWFSNLRSCDVKIDSVHNQLQLSGFSNE